MHINMLHAKTQLSRLVEAALRGEEVIIANRGKPMVKLVPAAAPAAPRAWGVWEGLLSDAQLDAAFSPEADAALASDWLDNTERRALRVAEPSAAYHAVLSDAPATKRSGPSRRASADRSGSTVSTAPKPRKPATPTTPTKPSKPA